MASLLAWRDSWLLGIEELDKDHFELVQLLNRLIETGQRPATRRHEGPEDESDPVLMRLQSVIDHLRKHFVSEEAFLQRIGYREVSEHKREHALLLAELVDLRRRLGSSEAEQVDEETLGLLRDWFLHHIAEDQRFAWYYSQQIRKATAEDQATDSRQLRYGTTDGHGPTQGYGRATSNFPSL